MPEVVEVALTALSLNAKLKNTKITNIKITGGRYSRNTMKGLSGFKNSLPLKINKIDSKGKFLWFELSNKNTNYYILNKFGLEGEWTFVSSKHSNIEFEILDNKKKYMLYFTDSRNFGTMEMTNNEQVLQDQLDKLAPDFLKENFTNNDLYERLENLLTNKIRENWKIVEVLMDQTIKGGLGSGLGNYLTAEILYHAKISPYKTLGELYDNKILVNRLAKSIKYITKLSFFTTDIEHMEHINTNKINNINYHPEIKINNKKFTFKVYGQKKDPNDNKVNRDVIIKGRGTYWVPTIQK